MMRLKIIPSAFDGQAAFRSMSGVVYRLRIGFGQLPWIPGWPSPNAINVRKVPDLTGK